MLYGAAVEEAAGEEGLFCESWVSGLIVGYFVFPAACGEGSCWSDAVQPPAAWN